MMGLLRLQEETPESSLHVPVPTIWGHSEKVTRKKSLTGNRIYQCLDLGLQSFRHCEKHVSMV